MRNTRNKRRLAEIQDNFEDNNNRGSSRERSQGDLNENYITQVSQEIEGRIDKKLSQEFAKRESRILGALAKLNDFLCKPQDTKGASTPKQKITSVTGNFEAQSSSSPDREGYVLPDRCDPYHIPDPEETVHTYRYTTVLNVTCKKSAKCAV